VSINGATAIAMRRGDDAGSIIYAGTNLSMRRSGPRIALVSTATSITVKSGESLRRIALRIYGDAKRAADIARLNTIANPDLIFPGQVLNLEAVEHLCGRTPNQQAGFALNAAMSPYSALNRRAFSPPTSRQPELRRVRASATDPPLP
jgi:LysM repeat protein